MTKAEFESLGLTVDQYKDEMGEEPVIDDIEVNTDPVDVTPAIEEPVEAIVPVETKAEVATNGTVLEFKNLKAAAEYLATMLNLKVTNTLDGLYKTIKRGTNKTHGYTVNRRDDKTVSLTKIA